MFFFQQADKLHGQKYVGTPSPMILNLNVTQYNDILDDACLFQQDKVLVYKTGDLLCQVGHIPGSANQISGTGKRICLGFLQIWS